MQEMADGLDPFNWCSRWGAGESFQLHVSAKIVSKGGIDSVDRVRWACLPGGLEDIPSRHSSASGRVISVKEI
jgi:hypothetical protein